MEWGRQFDEPAPTPPALIKQKVRPNVRLPCCFRAAEEEKDRPVAVTPLSQSTPKWIRLKSGELPEFKEWYRGLMTRMGRSSRRGFMEFRYDPLSYALNFDEGGEDGGADAEGVQYRNFSARLPATPMHPAAGVDCC